MFDSLLWTSPTGQAGLIYLESFQIGPLAASTCAYTPGCFSSLLWSMKWPAISETRVVSLQTWGDDQPIFTGLEKACNSGPEKMSTMVYLTCWHRISLILKLRIRTPLRFRHFLGTPFFNPKIIWLVVYLPL